MGSKENKNDDELFSLFYDGGYLNIYIQFA